MNRIIRALIILLLPLTTMGALTVNNGGGATNITSTSAWITATIVSTGAANPYLYSYWGTNNGSTNVASWGHTNSYGISTQGTYSAHITGLSGSTIYYFRTHATNTYATTNSESAWASYTAQFITLTTPTSVPPSSVRAVTADTNAVLKNPTNFFGKNASKIHDALSVYGYLTNEALWTAASGSVVYATDSSYTDTVAKASTAYGWGDHAEVGYITNESLWIAVSNQVQTDLDNLGDATNALNTRAGNLESATNALNIEMATKVSTNDTRQLDFTGADVRVADGTETNHPVTKAQLDANSGTTNASGIHVAFTPTNYTPDSADVEGHLIGIDAVVASGSGFPLTNNGDLAGFSLTNGGIVQAVSGAFDYVDIGIQLRMTNSESAGALEVVDLMVDADIDDLYYARRNGAWADIGLVGLQGATNALNTRVGNLEASTNALNTRAGALESSTNNLNIMALASVTGGTVVAGSANTFTVADRNATVTWNTNDAGGECVNTNTAYVFASNLYAVGWGQKVQDLGLKSDSFTVNPNLGTYIKMQYSNTVWTCTVANLPAGWAIPVTFELTRGTQLDGTKTTIYWEDDVYFPGGWTTNFSLSTTTGAVDIIQMLWNGSRYNVFNAAWDIK